MIDDSYIISLFYGTRQLKWQSVNKYILCDDDNDIKKYLSSRYNDGYIVEKDYKEILTRIKEGIEEIPRCPVCFSKNRFDGKKYTSHCCVSCARRDPESVNKRFDTNIKRYGSNNNINKMRETCRKRYGVDNVYEADWCVEKIKDTCMKRYGKSNFMKTDSFKMVVKSQVVIDKRNDTKRKNGAFNKSDDEERSYMLLKERFGDEVKRQYKSDLYPFSCDFYIPSIDLYIECNYHWTHGGHPYDQESEADAKTLGEWRSKGTRFYENAIDVWTMRDVNKRRTALNNNINIIEVWDYSQLENILKNI